MWPKVISLCWPKGMPKNISLWRICIESSWSTKTTTQLPPKWDFTVSLHLKSWLLHRRPGEKEGGWKVEHYDLWWIINHPNLYCSVFTTAAYRKFSQTRVEGRSCGGKCRLRFGVSFLDIIGFRCSDKLVFVCVHRPCSNVIFSQAQRVLQCFESLLGNPCRRVTTTDCNLLWSGDFILRTQLGHKSFWAWIKNCQK